MTTERVAYCRHGHEKVPGQRCRTCANAASARSKRRVNAAYGTQRPRSRGTPHKSAHVHTRVPRFSATPACQGADLHQFFAHDGERPPQKGAPQRVRNAARDYCSECPVRAECGQLGVWMRAVGLWGGYWMSLHSDLSHTALPLIAETREDI